MRKGAAGSGVLILSSASVLEAPLRMSLIQKALGYQPGAFVLSVVVVDNLPQSYPQCKSLMELICLSQEFHRYYTQTTNTLMRTQGVFFMPCPRLVKRGGEGSSRMVAKNTVILLPTPESYRDGGKFFLYAPTIISVYE